MNMKRFIISIVFLLAVVQVFPQFAYRITGDILTKTRMPDSTFQVSKGKMYYDQNYKKIVFDFSFPQKEKVVLVDTTMYIYRADTLYGTARNFLIPEQSFFHYMLSGKMSNYGLEASNFKAKGFEKKKDLVITTWEAPAEIKQ
jgi:hypothetical protein